ncbi:AraC family transcriptional regulator [Streptomyces sp. TS71-3]|uniref:AraC family transcriptional regulator n=1 Tax=Streptomyces sp. TS71-3 TaxID=2733862 RepID=UPI001B05DB4D|nr:AraC family transcriptional regulator [Streptomyces sp. TS71-3]GHJ41342.1 AraC family transcriptional regulator [Streptomyces sp. TS71-3]
MRASFEHIVPTPAMSWKLWVRSEPRFSFHWHFHPEYELTLITGGTGTRVVGDSVQDYGPGDLTLIGPDVPHTYASSPGQAANEAVVVQFRRDFLGGELFARPEFAAVSTLLERASRGVRFPRGTGPSPGGEPLPEAPSTAALIGLPPAERTLGLLRILVALAGRDDHRFLAGAGYSPAPGRAAGQRIDAMMRLLHTGYTRPIGLEEVAEAAGMAPSSASRFFRRTTGTTLTAYLNALRVRAACHLLAATDRRVADIAADCGYANLANFNRRFREVTGMAPREYRARLRRP